MITKARVVAVVLASALGSLGAAPAIGTPSSHSSTVAREASSHITSVVFTGSAKHPTITIKGGGFGKKPKPNLPIAPYKAGAKYDSACSRQRVVSKTHDGHDYSKHALGIGWSKTKPTGYGAGVYVPGSYVDCIGLRIVSYSATKVVLRPGTQYALYPGIKSGEHALIAVNGAHRRLTVHYKH
jgi:hypothetical protein